MEELELDKEKRKKKLFGLKKFKLEKNQSYFIEDQIELIHQAMQREPYQINALMIGELMSGKTSLILASMQNKVEEIKFDENSYSPTIENNYSFHLNPNLKINVLDTSGGKRKFNSLFFF